MNLNVAAGGAAGTSSGPVGVRPCIRCAPYASGELAIDYAARRVTVAGEPLELTAMEYSVLYALAVSAPRVLTHSDLLQRLWVRSGWASPG